MITLPHYKYQINQCTVNCHDMTISVEQQSITLPAKVFDFLKLLILHAGTTVTKEQVIDEIWLGNVEVGKRGAGNAIWHLRKSFTELGLEPDEILKTVTKVGYQLITKPIVIDELPQVTEKIASSSKNKYILYACFIGLFFSALFLFFPFSIDKPSDVATSAKTYINKPLKITNFEGVEEQAAISPDGRYMAFKWRRTRKNSKIYIKEIAAENAALRQVSMTNDNEVSPSWSPDSQSIAYFRINKLGLCSLHIRELISNTDQQLADDCINTGFSQGLDWSPDGKKIAYAKKMPDRVAVAIYNIADKTTKPYSFPNAGEKDLIMKWGLDSKALIFVRSSDLTASIFLIDEQNSQQTLVENEKMILGLAWDHSANNIYFNSMKLSDFVISRYNVSTKEVSEFYHGKGIGSIKIDEHGKALYFSQHVAQEFIAIHSLENGKLMERLVSSSRDLYGQYVAKSGDMLFLSNRSDSWELWLKDKNSSKQLTNHQGQVTIPAVSPVDNSFVIPMKRVNSDKFVMFQARLPTGKQTPLFEIDGDVRNPSYSIDGESLYFSSNVDGDWAIYRYNFATQSIVLITSEHGKFAIESADGGIYFSKENMDGIFYQSADKTTHYKVTPYLRQKDWGSFFYLNNALHYLKRTDELDLLVRIDQEGNEHTILTFPVFSIRNDRAFSTIKNNQVVVTMQGINDADIYKIPFN